MIVKMTILRLLGSSDDKEKEKIGVARPEGPPLRGFRQGHRCIRRLSEEPTLRCLVQEEIEAKSAYRHRLNRRSKKGHRCIGRTMYQRRCQVPRRSFFSTGSTDGASEYCVGALTSAEEKKAVSDRFNRWASIGSTDDHCVSCQEFNGYFGS